MTRPQENESLAAVYPTKYFPWKKEKKSAIKLRNWKHCVAFHRPSPEVGRRHFFAYKSRTPTTTIFTSSYDFLLHSVFRFLFNLLYVRTVLWRSWPPRSTAGLALQRLSNEIPVLLHREHRARSVHVWYVVASLIVFHFMKVLVNIFFTCLLARVLKLTSMRFDTQRKNVLYHV